jgi:hypothetical protein
MKKRWLIFVLAVILTCSAGCATATSSRDLEIQALRNQISALEVKLQAKEQELNSLRQASAVALSLEGQPAEPALIKGHPRQKAAEFPPQARKLQLALKHAGYDPGPIDGRLGPKTREALKAFQRSNSLAVTGKADQATWKLLSGYLERKIK